MDPLIAQLTPIKHSLTSHGSQVHYWEYNADKQPTIFVIHGYRGTHHGLERIIAHLPQYRFIVPDLPGFGSSTPMQRQPHSIHGYSEAAADIMRSLKLKNTVVIGHSLGSIITAELAKNHPELISQLILINPISSHPLKGISGILLRPAILYHWLGGKVLPEKLGRKLLDSKQFLLFGSVMMATTKDKQLRQIVHANHLTHMPEYDNSRTLYDAYLASLSGTVTDRAHGITMPTLLIAGTKDALAPLSHQHTLASKLTSVKLVAIDNVGHLVHYEKAAEAAEAIDHFIATQPRARK
jgi:pimeloyl-ACP methyl ester carboxylesterase